MPQRIQLLQQIAHKISLGLHHQAARLAQLGTEVLPDDPECWQLLGISLAENHQWLPAREALEHAQILAPMTPFAALALANAYLETGMPDLAHSAFRHLACLREVPVSILPRLAKGLGRLADFRRALRVCRRLVHSQPNHAPAHFGVAYYLVRRGANPQTVLPWLRAAHRLQPQSPMYLINLGLCLAQADLPSEAAKILRDVPYSAVTCPYMAGLIAAVFEQVSDPIVRSAWLERARLVADQRTGSTYSPPDETRDQIDPK